LHTSGRHDSGNDDSLDWLRSLQVVLVGSSISLTVAEQTFRRFGATTRTVMDLEELRTDTCVDIVLVDRLDGADQFGPLGAEYADFVCRHNRNVWVTLSGYGLSGPDATSRASDATILAAAGILGHSFIAPELPPTVPAGQLALTLAGDFLVLSALHGVLVARAGSRPVHVDLPADACVMATGLVLELAHALMACPDQGGSSRYGAPSGFFPASDGLVYVLVLEDHQWSGLRACVNRPELADIRSVDDAKAHSDLVNTAVRAWVGQRPKAECEALLQAAGVACTAVRTVDEFVAAASAHAHDVTRFSPLPALPAIVWTEASESSPALAAADLLARLRVLDAGHVLAVPLATAWLGAIGANVSKLEDRARLDVYRRRGPFAEGQSGPNASAYFNAINYCKTTIAVEDVAGSDGTIDGRHFDVIVHNLSPRRARALGVDRLPSRGPGSARLLITSTGLGIVGPWADFRAYGHNIHAAAGLVAGTKDATGASADMGTPWCDPLTSVAIAIHVLAWVLGCAAGSPRSATVSISMAETMAGHLAYGASATKQPVPVFIQWPGQPQRMLVAAFNGNDEISRFAEFTGIATPLDPQPYRVCDGCDSRFAQISAFEFERMLRSNGFDVAVIRQADDLAGERSLRDRGIVRAVSSVTLGNYEVVGLPWAFLGTQPDPLQAAPEWSPLRSSVRGHR
jgi:crotonobetainyl-CoA:carnitine CoA-transferase CaiB-like acyl-CoA transferase